jgi:hypothetical protein
MPSEYADQIARRDRYLSFRRRCNELSNALKNVCDLILENRNGANFTNHTFRAYIPPSNYQRQIAPVHALMTGAPINERASKAIEKDFGNLFPAGSNESREISALLSRIPEDKWIYGDLLVQLAEIDLAVRGYASTASLGFRLIFENNLVRAGADLFDVLKARLRTKEALSLPIILLHSLAYLCDLYSQVIDAYDSMSGAQQVREDSRSSAGITMSDKRSLAFSYWRQTPDLEQRLISGHASQLCRDAFDKLLPVHTPLAPSLILSRFDWLSQDLPRLNSVYQKSIAEAAAWSPGIVSAIRAAAEQGYLLNAVTQILLGLMSVRKDVVRGEITTLTAEQEMLLENSSDVIQHLRDHPYNSDAHVAIVRIAIEMCEIAGGVSADGSSAMDHECRAKKYSDESTTVIYASIGMAINELRKYYSCETFRELGIRLEGSHRIELLYHKLSEFIDDSALFEVKAFLALLDIPSQASLTGASQSSFVHRPVIDQLQFPTVSGIIDIHLPPTEEYVATICAACSRILSLDRAQASAFDYVFTKWKELLEASGYNSWGSLDQSEWTHMVEQIPLKFARKLFDPSAFSALRQEAEKPLLSLRAAILNWYINSSRLRLSIADFTVTPFMGNFNYLLSQCGVETFNIALGSGEEYFAFADVLVEVAGGGPPLEFPQNRLFTDQCGWEFEIKDPNLAQLRSNALQRDHDKFLNRYAQLFAKANWSSNPMIFQSPFIVVPCGEISLTLIIYCFLSSGLSFRELRTWLSGANGNESCRVIPKSDIPEMLPATLFDFLVALGLQHQNGKPSDRLYHLLRWPSHSLDVEGGGDEGKLWFAQIPQLNIKELNERFGRSRISLLSEGTCGSSSRPLSQAALVALQEICDWLASANWQAISSEAIKENYRIGDLVGEFLYRKDRCVPLMKVMFLLYSEAEVLQLISSSASGSSRPRFFPRGVVSCRIAGLFLSQSFQEMLENEALGSKILTSGYNQCFELRGCEERLRSFESMISTFGIMGLELLAETSKSSKFS